MDPNAALQRLREILSLANTDDPPGSIDMEQMLTEAGELFRGLDEWIGDGGVLPADWNPATYKSRSFHRLDAGPTITIRQAQCKKCGWALKYRECPRGTAAGDLCE